MAKGTMRRQGQTRSHRLNVLLTDDELRLYGRAVEIERERARCESLSNWVRRTLSERAYQVIGDRTAA